MSDRTPNRFGPCDYDSDVVPLGYVCAECGAYRVKLWRQSDTTASEVRLLCGPCALLDQGVRGPLDATGRRIDRLGCRTDQIGGLYPAVPTEKGDTFCGYTTVSDAAVDWWRRLYTYPPPKDSCHG